MAAVVVQTKFVKHHNRPDGFAVIKSSHDINMSNVCLRKRPVTPTLGTRMVMLRKNTRFLVASNRKLEAALNIVWKKNVLILSRISREIVAGCNKNNTFQGDRLIFQLHTNSIEYATILSMHLSQQFRI